VDLRWGGEEPLESRTTGVGLAGIGEQDDGE
jgi:hypothetical protein